jgi:phenylpropionate dioxygenase-like ring-hydroxylating dioxygenase large terminal subunit
MVHAGPEANGSGTFSWGKHWYGVAAARDLDPSHPNAITLLGTELVVWKDNNGAWRCLEDRCPHRAAPLSGQCAPPGCTCRS